MSKLLYLDNAATTKTAPEVVEAMLPYFTEKFGNPSSVYSFAAANKEVINQQRDTIAEMIGAKTNEIYFTGGGSESDNWALKATAEAYASKGNHIITSKIEHHAILHTCDWLEKHGFEITYVDVDEFGKIKLDELKKAIRPTTILISVMFANNEIGTIQPIKEIGEIAHEHGILFHTDAVQAYGQLPINVDELHIDMLSSSGHKLNGPKGIGFLYLKKGTVLSSFIDGGSQEFGLRAGTENVASIVAMSVALKNNYKEMERNRAHLLNLETTLLSKLESSGLDYIHNGSNNRIPGNISLSFKNVEGEMLLHRLDLQKICISTGSACDSKNTQISHVIKAINVPSEYAKGTIRISFGKQNTIEEAEKIAGTLIKIMK